MKIEKFDQMSEKLITRLNEECALFEENDGLVNTKDNGQEKTVEDTLRDKRNKTTTEKKEAFNNRLNYPSDATKLRHKKLVVDEKENDATLSKFKYAKNLSKVMHEDFSIDELNDDDASLLADEFERDLNEQNDVMLKSAEILKKEQQNKDKKYHDQYETVSDKMEEETEELEKKHADEQKKEEERVAKEQEAESKKIEDQKAKLEADKQKKEQESERINKKIDAIKAAAKEDNTTMNEEYDQNVKMFKEEQEKQIALEESFKKKMAERKLKKAEKKLDKASEKESKVAIKKAELTNKYGIDDENAENFEQLFIKEKDKRKATKIKAKWDKLSGKQKYIHSYTVKPADDAVKDAEYKNKKLSEDIEFDNLMLSTDKLLEEVDMMIVEFPLDEEFLSVTKKKSKKSEDSEPESKKETVEESKGSGSIEEKIKKEIEKEEKKESPDYQKIKSLKLKLKEYEE